jgi:hypothetical protein
VIKVEDSIRFRLCLLGASHPHLLDVGPVGGPKRIQLSEALVFAPRIEMADFQRYVGVLDVDGNAWSSRFAGLLCMDSVVLKVEPLSVDYFWFELEPWKHYVPIKADLTDLIEQAEWVLANVNQGEVRQIVQRANDWCARRLTRKVVAEDVLTILNSYAEKLEQYDPKWSEVWKRELRSSIFLPSNGMIRLGSGSTRL